MSSEDPIGVELAALPPSDIVDVDPQAAAVPLPSSPLLSRVLQRRLHLNLTSLVRVETPKIENGGYADLYIGYLTTPSGDLPGTRVAVKRLRAKLKDGRQQDIAKGLATEFRIWSELEHENVLPLLGYIMEDGFPALISAWVEDGSLHACMEKKGINRKEALRIVLDMASGLTYIHEKGAIHSDVKSDNVLVQVSPEKRALLTDFGISRMDSLSTGYSTFSSRGSTRWQAIEFFQDSDEMEDIEEEDAEDANVAEHKETAPAPPPQHTVKTDVWAFGMTVYEVLTNNRPYASIRNDVQVMHRISRGKLPEKPRFPRNLDPDDTAIERFLWTLCKDCWKTEPEERPLMSDLKALVQSECGKYKL